MWRAAAGWRKGDGGGVEGGGRGGEEVGVVEEWRQKLVAKRKSPNLGGQERDG